MFELERQTAKPETALQYNFVTSPYNPGLLSWEPPAPFQEAGQGFKLRLIESAIWASIGELIWAPFEK